MKCDRPRPRNRTVLKPQLLHNLQAKSQQRLHDSEGPVAGFQLRLAYLADAQPLSKCHLQNLDIQAKISPQTQFQKQPACCSPSGAKATALSACLAAGGAPPLTISNGFGMLVRLEAFAPADNGRLVSVSWIAVEVDHRIRLRSREDRLVLRLSLIGTSSWNKNSMYLIRSNLL